LRRDSYNQSIHFVVGVQMRRQLLIKKLGGQVYRVITKILRKRADR